MTRSSMLEVLGHDYVRTARAKGLAKRLILVRHALPNAAIPIVTVIGIQLGQLQKQVMAEAVWSFLWVPVESDAMRQYVQGYDHVAFDGFRDLMAATWVDKS